MEHESPQHAHPIDVTQHSSKLPKLLQYSFFKKPPKKRLLVVAGTSTFALLFGVGSIVALGPEPAAPDPLPQITTVQKPAPPTTVAAPLTGLQVAPELATLPVVGVMIENSIEARPQSGLQEAGVVFEAIAEGGITRFLALYQEANPENIGPIRSARPYYVQWAKGFNASYVHSGGSNEALALIRSLGVNDLDHGAFGEKIASRVSNRYAPHNVYTSMNRIRSVANEQGFTDATFTGFARAASNDAAAAQNATKIQFNISGANYNTSYVYNPETKDYARTLAGRPHTDQESGAQISPEVVIALIANYSIHPDGIHSNYGSIGSGEALVFQGGGVQQVRWSKPSETAALTFVDASGAPVLLAPGQTWITAVPSGRTTYN